MDQDLDIRDFSGLCRLFPLPGVVLFPHAVQPLHIFEPRYRQMTEDALAGDQLIAMVQVHSDADWSLDEDPAIEPVACLGRIIKHERLPDGRFNLLLQGCVRVRIVRELARATLYRQAEVELLPDLPSKSLDPSDREELIQAFRAIACQVGGLDPEFDALLESRPPMGVVTDLIAQSLGLPASLKQALLGDPRPERRGKTLLSILRQVSPGGGAARPFPPRFSDN